MNANQGDFVDLPWVRIMYYSVYYRDTSSKKVLAFTIRK